MLYDQKKDFYYGYGIGSPGFGNKPSFYVGLSYNRSSKHALQFGSSLNVCSKKVSLMAEDGGLGSFSELNADYNLYYADISVYPLISPGKKLKFEGSVRPNIGFHFASDRSGVKEHWYMTNEINQGHYAETVSGNGKNEFTIFSFDLAVNLKLEYPLDEKMAILLECQYSRGLTNISNTGEFEFNINNFLIGTGITIHFPMNRKDTSI